MIEKNSPDYVFRFLQLRPPPPLREARILIATATDTVARIVNSPKSRRNGLVAQLVQKTPAIANPLSGLKTREKLEDAAGEETFPKFRGKVANIPGQRGFQADYELLRNAHFARQHSAPGLELGDTAEVENVLALYVLAAEEPREWMEEKPVSELRALSVVFDAAYSQDQDSPASNDDAEGQEVKRQPSRREKQAALQSLTLISGEPGMVVTHASRDKDDCDRDAVVGSLANHARKLLPEQSRETFQLMGMSIDQPVSTLMSAMKIDAQLTGFFPFFPWFDPGLGVGGGLSSDGKVRPAGVGDLLVVKQAVKRYEAMELAHVENVMAGETRSRTHRTLDRYEEVFIEEDETTREETEELQTAERHEMNREVSKTLKNERKIGFKLSLSGKYGPTVEFSSNFSLATTSEEQSTKSASEFAREVMSKSTERIVERHRREQRLTILRETEETNLHEFKNETAEHIIGQYQFLDKVQENRIFDYGKRLMFDFMVPEPASYLWHLQDMPVEEGEAPKPPIPLSSRIPDASHINDGNYRSHAAFFGASDVSPPPPFHQYVYASHKYGEGGSESGEPRRNHLMEIEIPEGYFPIQVSGSYSGLTDDEQSYEVSIAGNWDGDFEFRGDGVGNGHRLGTRSFSIPVPTSLTSPDTAKLGVNILVFESNNWSVLVRVQVERTYIAYEAWQNETYAAIHSAYLDQVSDYEQKLAKYEADRARAEQESEDFGGSTPYGDAPLANQLRILQELKKHCISILTQTHFESFGSLTDNGSNPPTIRFSEAMAEGNYIRFFEQAFEWDQMQYVFYPYFWANKSTWRDRFEMRDNDRLFQEFLRAGEARVVLPTRPGFERAINYYLETGLLWEGSSEPPLLGDPLYVSIITEIEERTGREKGEIPVGEPWESRLPTNLVRLRPEATLPEWENRDEDGWDWHPIEEE